MANSVPVQNKTYVALIHINVIFYQFMIICYFEAYFLLTYYKILLRHL